MKEEHEKLNAEVQTRAMPNNAEEEKMEQVVAKKKKAPQVLKFVNMTHVQCDQIWQIFATLANLKIIFWPFRGLL